MLCASPVCIADMALLLKATGKDRPSVLTQLQDDVFFNDEVELLSARSMTLDTQIEPVLLSDWDTLTRFSTDTDLVYNGVFLDLRQEYVDPSKNLRIYCDTVHLDSRIVIPEKSVFIFCRVLECGPSAVIDVSGARAVDRVDKAPPVDGFGASGRSGSPGFPGTRAGNITIYAGAVTGEMLLLGANGGAGGSGQIGGDGNPGQGGGAGANAPDPGMGAADNPGAPGGPGQAGGNAGQGGVGGQGGDAGEITFFYLDRQPELIPKTESLGGKGGQGGAPGSPGPGGPGGPGGINRAGTWKTRCYGGRGERECEDRWVVVNSGRAPSGPGGPNGSAASAGSTGRPGQSKTATAEIIGGGQMGSRASLTHLLMTLHAAERSYINEKYRETAQVLFWLRNLLSDSPGSLTPAFLAPGSPYAGPSPSTKEWEALRNRVDALIAQLGLGLDYYGFPRQYVSLLSIEVYKAAIKTLLPIAQDINDARDRYLNASNEANDRLVAVRDAISGINNALNQLEHQRVELGNAQAAAAAEAARLLVDVLARMRELERAEQGFQDAVTRKQQESGGCGFLEALAAIAAIATVAAGVYAATAAVITAVAEATAEIASIVTIVKAVQAEVVAIKNAYEQIKPLLDGNPDAGKIVVPQEDYERVLQPYMDMPEAQIYKAAIRALLDTIKARNQKVLDSAAFFAQIMELQAAMEQRREEALRIQSLAVSHTNPELPELLLFMGKALDTVKADIVRLMYMQNKAIEYWSLVDRPLALWGKSVPDLEASFADLINAEVRALEDRNRNPQPLTPKPRITFKREVHKTEFAGLDDLDRRSFAFSIRLKDPAFNAPWSAILVRSVRITMAGAPEGLVWVELQHSGTATVVKWDDRRRSRPLTFSHKPRNTVIALQNGISEVADVQDNLGGGEAFSYLSPFSVWTLSLAPESGDVDLSGVTEITVEFEGTFMPFQ